MLTIKSDKFHLNDKPFRLFSGAIHYFRTMPEYWHDRLAKLKACGFNTVETYVPWNWHEAEPGQFNFDGILDVERFIQTATDLGLYIIFRPGPYICAEWEFGGLPAWLLRDPKMRVRCMYKPYLDAVERFYKKLLPLVTKYQISNGGNIIAMQVENEYGSYSNDKEYLRWVEKLMKDCGVDVLLFTSDGPTDWMLSGGTLPHIYKTVNFGLGLIGDKFERVKKFGEEGPSTCMEFWLGWFDHWGKKHITKSPWLCAKNIKSMLDLGANFNLYMFHGGTNFGYWSGANYDSHYWPTVTSYDYDALLTESGGLTKKYHKVRKEMQKYLGTALPEPPPEQKAQALGKVKLTQTAGFWDNFDTLANSKSTSVNTERMESYNQNYGFISYTHTVDGAYSNARVCLDGLNDIGYIFVNGKYKGMCVRTRETSLNVGNLKTGDKLTVLVEGMGRVNYGVELHDRKGVERIKIHNQLLTYFEVATVAWDSLANNEKIDFTTNKTVEAPPVLYKSTFTANSQADTYLYLNNFKKGMVWINGFALGRYWDIGPQRSLYVPGVLLKNGENTIEVVELASVPACPVVEFKDYYTLK
jgi:beta-galactosidase